MSDSLSQASSSHMPIASIAIKKLNWRSAMKNVAAALVDTLRVKEEEDAMEDG